jgi:hypothetical protein
MDARPPLQPDQLPDGMLPAGVVLLLGAIALMVCPAAVAVISIVDGGLLDRPYGWLSSGVALAGPFLVVARLGMILASAGAVRTAREDT